MPGLSQSCPVPMKSLTVSVCQPFQGDAEHDADVIGGQHDQVPCAAKATNSMRSFPENQSGFSSPKTSPSQDKLKAKFSTLWPWECLDNL